MTVDPLDFLDSSEDPLSFLDENQSNKSLRKVSRLGAQYGIGAAELAALPYEVAVGPLASEKAQMVPYRESLFEDIERLQEQKAAGVWSSQDQQLLDHLLEQAKNPEKSKQFVKTADIGVGSLVEKAAEQFGIDLKPEDLAESGARIAGGLISPKTATQIGIKGSKIFTKSGREALKEAKELSKWKQLERSVVKDPEREQLLSFSKEKQLTPEEATLLIQTKGKIDLLSKLARKSKKFKSTAENLRKKLGSEYESLKSTGKHIGFLTQKEKGILQGDLQKLVNELGETYIEGPDTRAARVAIEDAITKIGDKEGTIKDLINSRQGLRESTNWNNIDKGDVLRGKAEEVLLKAIQRKDPKIAKSLEMTDKAWSQYKKFEKILSKKQPFISVKGIPVPDFMSNLAFTAALGAFGGPKAVIAKEASRRIAEKFLTDPKYQAIHKNLLHALKTGSTKNQKEIFLLLKRSLKKDDPDLYEEFKDLSVD